MTELEESASILDRFRAFDRNGDGTISKDELKFVLQEVDSEQWNDARILKLFEAADANSDGDLSYEEFVAWISAEEGSELADSLGAFRVEMTMYDVSAARDAKCEKGCGRLQFRGHTTCCTHCKGADGPHARGCNLAHSGGKCIHGCGRAPFKGYQTCCTRCKGVDGPHARSCGDIPTKSSTEGRTTTSIDADKVHDNLLSLLGPTLLTTTGKESAATALAGAKFVMVYFSAHWCPPCRGFTPQLAECYKSSARVDTKIVFASSDHDERSFQEYYSEMPWLAVPFESRDVKANLSRVFDVTGIPCLIVLGKDGSVVTKNGRSAYRDYL